MTAENQQFIEWEFTHRSSIERFADLVRQLDCCECESDGDIVLAQMDQLAEAMLAELPAWCNEPAKIDGELYDEPRVKMMLLISSIKAATERNGP